jgi:hypothetical protein
MPGSARTNASSCAALSHRNWSADRCSWGISANTLPSGLIRLNKLDG